MSPPSVTTKIAQGDGGRYASLVSEFAVALGRAVEFARRRRGWTQEQLAERADLNRGYLGAIERGERSAVSVESIVKLAVALETKMSTLMAAAEEEMGKR